MTPVAGPALASVGGDMWMHVADDGGVRAVRRRALDLAVRAGFDETRAGEAGIVATELATNLVKHATEGTVVLRVVRDGEDTGVELLAFDAGPGRRDIEALVVDGESTSGTLGIGLGAVRRLSGSLELHSLPGHGTVVDAVLWRTRHLPARPDVSGLTRPLRGQEVCGDAIAARSFDGGTLVMVADGLGHGPLAAVASHRATEAFATSTSTAPGDLVRMLHGALAGTRGAAVAVVRLDTAAGTLVHAGVGNISGRLVGDGRPRGMVSQPGIVGHNLPRIRETSYDVEPGQAVVLHSDGLTEKWDLAALPGLHRRGPAVLAAALMRDAGTRRDDASVLVLKAPA